LKFKKKKLFCAFIDIEKDFHRIRREALWYKLLMSNISGNIYRIIFNMCNNNIKSCLLYNGEKSKYIPCEVGVRPDKNLSPFYFR